VVRAEVHHLEVVGAVAVVCLTHLEAMAHRRQDHTDHREEEGQYQHFRENFRQTIDMTFRYRGGYRGRARGYAPY